MVALYNIIKGNKNIITQVYSKQCNVKGINNIWVLHCIVKREIMTLARHVTTPVKPLFEHLIADRTLERHELFLPFEKIANYFSKKID